MVLSLEQPDRGESPGRPSPDPREDSRSIPGSSLNTSAFSKMSLFHFLTQLFPFLVWDIPASLPGRGTEVVAANSAANPFAPGGFYSTRESRAATAPRAPNSAKNRIMGRSRSRKSRASAAHLGAGHWSCGRQEHLSPRGCCLSPAASTVSPRPLVTPLSQLCPGRGCCAFALQQSQIPLPKSCSGSSPLSCSPQSAAVFSWDSWGQGTQPQWDSGDSQTYLKSLFQGDKVPPSSEQAEGPSQELEGVPCAPNPLLPPGFGISLWGRGAARPQTLSRAAAGLL